MDVLHYSFSLSACPKCHLLVCKHTSLANLDFCTIEQQQRQEEEKQLILESNDTTSNQVKSRSQRLSSHGMNFYVLPSTTTTSDNRHSWTTFGTGSIESSNTLENVSMTNETLSENTPFANENIVHFSSPLKPTFNQIVRTQSERCQKNFQPRVCLTKSYSFSTINTTPKSNKSLASSPLSQQDNKSTNKSHSNLSLFFLVILIISYLLTNTLDIVLLYIYYHTNYLYFLIFTVIIFACDIILWINNLLDRKNLPTRLLLIPFLLRFYILYELVELMIILFNETVIVETPKLNSSSSTSSSTTTTLETNLSQATDESFIHQQKQSQSYKTMKRRLFHSLALFYLIHSSLLVFVNLYFWSNNFQLSTKSTINMHHFIPQWTTDDNDEDDLFVSTSMNLIPVQSSIGYWAKFDDDRKHIARRTMSLNWTLPVFYRAIPLSIRLPSSFAFLITSIFYHLIVNYCFLSTFLTLKRASSMIFLSILSRFCLIMTRIYTFIFLIRLNAWWFAIMFFVVHFSLMITLLCDRSKVHDHQTKMFIELIFSLLTHSSIRDVSINALISLENISIFLHRLYLETFSTHNETTLRLIIFLSILISLQILGFLFDILSKNSLYRAKTANQTITKL